MRAKEFDLLERLARDPGSALSRQTLMAEVWNDRWGGSTKTLDVHVASLRKRLSGLPAGTRLPRILTLRGHGYRLEPPGPQRAIGPPSAALQPASNDGRWRRVRTRIISLAVIIAAIAVALFGIPLAFGLARYAVAAEGSTFAADRRSHGRGGAYRSRSRPHAGRPACRQQ